MSVAWVRIPDSQRFLYTPVGLRLVDDFTGKAPSGGLAVTLEAKDGALPDTWNVVDFPATLTPGGWVAFVGLGRTTRPQTKPTIRHRVSLEADSLLALYGLTPVEQHVEFDVPPFDDLHLPPPVVKKDIFLLPGTTYGFPGEVAVARGRVVDAASKPVSRALVTYQHLERVLTDARGEFALPLRWAAKNSSIQIDAGDGAGDVGGVTVTVPGGLRRALEIQIA